MTKEEAKNKFRLADRLFNEHQFGPALKVLTELNAAFPGERHVLYPMARCLTGLGRNAEALDLADRVVREFDYGPAVDLYKRLKSMKTDGGIGMLDSWSDPVLPPGVLTMDSDPIELPGGIQKFDSDPVKLGSEFDSLIDRPAARPGAPPPLPAASGGDWKPVALWIALIVGGLFVTVAISLSMGRPIFDFVANAYEQGQQVAENPNSDPVEVAAASTEEIQALWLLIVPFAVYWYLPTCVCAYFALKIMEALPFGDFGSDMKDIAVYNLLGYLLSCIPFIGWIGTIIIIKNHYDMTLGRTLLTCVLYNVFSSIAGLVLGAAYLFLVVSFA